MGSELGRDTHRLVLWKMVVVAKQNRVQGKQQERKKEGERGCGSVAKPLPRQAREPGSNLW